jgi:integrase
VKPAKTADGEIAVFTPAEFSEILNQASEAFVPFLVLAGLAGVRHAEIKRLEWPDIQFDEGFVEIRARKSKTASRRLVPIQENLKAWLLPRKKNLGPVCTVINTGSEIARMVDRINAERRRERKKAGLPLKDKDGKMSWKFAWKHNALRHSYISYRVAQTQDVAKVCLLYTSDAADDM